MTGVAEMVVPAALLAALAAVGLACLPDAPPRARFSIAVLGLAAWIVPWPLVELAVGAPGFADLAAWAGGIQIVSLSAEPSGDVVAAAPTAGLRYALLALCLPGAVLFAADCRRLRRGLERFRRASRSGEELRTLLPQELRDVRAEIRIVDGISAAAASGWVRRTIWIGGELPPGDAALALLHEAWHVRRFDPAWIMAITAVRRAYWWNPLVRWLCDEAISMLESECDRRCARHIGRRRYVRSLAAMMLRAEAGSPPALAAGAWGTSSNVERLKRLSRRARMRVRDRWLVAALAAASLVVIGNHVAEREARPAWSDVEIPATPAGASLTTLLDALDDGNTELARLYLGAYTPQEVALPASDWARGVRLLRILRSEPTRIEYIVRSDATGITRRGRLEVVGRASASASASGAELVAQDTAGPGAGEASR